MAKRIEKKEFIRRLAGRMQTDEATAARWLDGGLEEMYQTFRSGCGLTLPVSEASIWIGDERAGPSSSTPVRSCEPSSAGPPLTAVRCSASPRCSNQAEPARLCDHIAKGVRKSCR